MGKSRSYLAQLRKETKGIQRQSLPIPKSISHKPCSIARGSKNQFQSSKHRLLGPSMHIGFSIQESQGSPFSHWTSILSKEVWKSNFWPYGQMEKAEVGRVRGERKEVRRSGKRKSEKKEDAGARKGRKAAMHCVFPMICGPGGSKQ